jgi:pimeloyl-ACP methyl ester carboxylesterase
MRRNVVLYRRIERQASGRKWGLLLGFQVILACLSLLSGSGALSLADETASPRLSANKSEVPRFEKASCPFSFPSDVAVECGYLVVRENRQRQDSPTIRLAVAIISSRSDHPAPDPAVFLTGGPGQSAFESASLWFHTPFLDRRDFILFEQRGTRYSEPWLDCPEVDAALLDSFATASSLEEEVAGEANAAKACRDRLQRQGIDLSAYNSKASAADLEELRQVLGYDKWNLYAVSYGTRLALAVMRDHPVGLRSVILDSVYLPQASFYEEFTPKAMQTFEALFAACASDVDCQAAYPDLERTFYDTVARMNDDPVPLSIHIPPYDLILTGDDWAAMLFDVCYESQALPFVPFLIYQVREANYDVLPPLVEQIFPVLTSFSRGMYYSVQCYEEAPFNTPEAVAEAIDAYPGLGDFSPFRSDLAVCDVWGLDSYDVAENLPVYSDVPTLVLCGEYDPITPSRWGRLATETLSNSFFYEFPGLSHSITLHACPRDVASAFIDDPTGLPVVDCMNEVNRLHFITGEDVYVTPAIYRLNVDLLTRRHPFHLGVLGFCLLFFLAEVLLLPGNLIRSLRHRAEQTARMAWLARGLAVVTAVANLVFVVGLVLTVGKALSVNWLILAFGMPAKAAFLVIFPPLAAVSSIGALVISFWVWKRGVWTALARVHYSMVVVAGLIFIWFLSYWGLLVL